MIIATSFYDIKRKMFTRKGYFQNFSWFHIYVYKLRVIICSLDYSVNKFSDTRVYAKNSYSFMRKWFLLSLFGEMGVLEWGQWRNREIFRGEQSHFSRFFFQAWSHFSRFFPAWFLPFPGEKVNFGSPGTVHCFPKTEKQKEKKGPQLFLVIFHFFTLHFSFSSLLFIFF